MSAGEPAPDLPANIMKKANDSFKFSVNMLREIYASEFEYKKTGLAVFSERAHQAKAELDRELDFRTGFMSLRLNTRAYSPPRRQVMSRSSYMANKGNNNGNNKKTRKRQRQNTPNENRRLNEENKKFTNNLKERTRISREAVEEENRRERQALADEEDAAAAAEAAAEADAEEELIPSVRRGTMLAENSVKGNTRNNNSRYGRVIKASQEL